MGATRAEIKAATSLNALVALEQKYGYKRGWAEFVMRGRLKKRDGIYRSGKAGKEMARETPHKAPQDERGGAAGLAGQADLFAGNPILDRV